MRNKIALLIVLLSLLVFTACSSKSSPKTQVVTHASNVVTQSSTSSQPVHISNPVTGDYHQTRNAFKKLKLSAKITQNHIRITLHLNGTEGIFWDGTFDTAHTADQTFRVESIGNKKVMQASSYAPPVYHAPFTYSKGDLSFKFIVLGVSTIVHMAK